MEKTTSIVVTHQFDAVHSWDSIPPKHPSQFLKYPHRHIFYVRIEIEVYHNDRQLEFFQVKTWLEEECRQTWGYAHSGKGIAIKDSCEDMAHKLFDACEDVNFLVREVSVFEDNENGAIVRKK